MEKISASEFLTGCDPNVFQNWAQTPFEDRPKFVAAIIREAREEWRSELDADDVERELDLGYRA